MFSQFGSKGLRFVTASKDGSALVAQAKASLTEGGHFADLLSRLNQGSKKPEVQQEESEVSDSVQGKRKADELDSEAGLAKPERQKKKSKKNKTEIVDPMPATTEPVQAVEPATTEEDKPTPLARPVISRNAYVLLL